MSSEKACPKNGSAAHGSLIATMSARLAALERTIWQADPAQTNATIEQVCAVTLAQGGWLTPVDWSPAERGLSVGQ